MLSFKVTSFYVIAGIDNKGKRQWMAIDDHSGGYPYWCDNVLIAKRFDTAQKAPAYKVDDYMLAGASAWVMEVTLRAEPICALPGVDLRKAEVEKEILKLKDLLTQKEQELADLK